MRHVILLGFESFSSGPNAMIGQILGHYKVIEQLGAGGMGEVCLAEDTKLHRKVAIKLLPANLTTDKDRAARFRQEASAASALNHPNIIVIYEIGETDDGVLYIVSEYIRGRTLRERINSGNIDLVEALDVAIQAASALSAAHESGIIHRDIKPENVIIRPDGYVKVLDFGLAKLIESHMPSETEASTLVKPETAPGMILGTMKYMSPEQARGKEVDERTDVFSLGVLIYEIIAGRPPFTGQTNADVIAAILEKEPAGLARFVPETPDELQRIVSKMLRKERGERYQTMRDCLVDLKEVRTELQFAARLHSKELSPFKQPTEIIDAHTNSGTQRVRTGHDGRMSTVQTAATSSGTRKKAIVAAVILGVLFLSAAGTAYYLGIWQRSPVVLATQNVRQLTIWQGLDDFPSMSPDGNSVAYCSDHNGTFEIYVKALTPGARETQLTTDGGQNFEPAWSHDGTRIAYYSKLRGGIWVVPSTGGDIKQLTEFGSHPAWSQDDKQIVFQSNPVNDLGAFARNALPPSTLWLVPANGGEPRQLTQGGDPPGGHGSPDFSPDGQRVAFETNTFNSSSIWTVSINGDHLEPITPRGPGGGYAPVYSSDGRSIFYHSGQLFQIGLDPSSGKPLGEANRVTGFSQPPSVIRRISFSADGKRVAYSLIRRTESISSVILQTNSALPAATPVALVSNATGRNNYPAFSPDGKRIAFSACAVGGTGCDIWLADPDGSDQIQLTTAESTELLPSWFPDGEQIAYVSSRTGHDTYWAINLNTKRERMLLDVQDDLDYVRLSPDGKKVLFNRIRDGVMNVWTASLDGGEPKQLTFDEEMMAFPTWSPDGKFIAFQVKRGDASNVMIMPSDGGTPEQLTFDKGQSWIFGLSPDGDKILFAGQRDGYWNTWWVSRSTKTKQQLTDYKKLNSFVRYPAWSPKGDQIAYEYSETTGNIWVADVK